jgi:hypothetical protein
MTKTITKLTATLLALAIALSICGCGAKVKNEDASEDAIVEEDVAADTWSDGSKMVESKDKYFEWDDQGKTITGLTLDGKSMSDIVVPAKCTKVSGDVFALNEKLERVAFANPDTEFGAEFTGFIRCSNLAEIHFPQNMKEIPSYSCAGCERLTTIVWPQYLQTIQSDAFSECTSLRTVHLPNSILAVEAYAFNNCQYMSDLELGVNLAKLGNYAFQDCSSLLHVNLPTTLSEIGTGIFDGTAFAEAMSDEDLELLYPDTTGKSEDMDVSEEDTEPKN